MSPQTDGGGEGHAKWEITSSIFKQRPSFTVMIIVSKGMYAKCSNYFSMIVNIINKHLNICTEFTEETWLTVVCLVCFNDENTEAVQL